MSASVPSGRARLTVPLLGIFAVLLQAILWGWHHHAYAPLSRAEGGFHTVAAGLGDSTPTVHDELCQICFTLGHHGVVPADLGTPALLDHFPSRPLRATAVNRRIVSYLLFRSRAPPLI